MDDLITAAEAARLLHLNVKHVQALARAGRLPAVRTGRKWLFRRHELLRGLRTNVEHTVDELSSGVDISARNQLVGRVTSVRLGDVMAEVELEVGDQQLTAVITSSSAERLGLRVGIEVFAVIKSTEVMIARPAGRPHGS